MIDEWDVLVVDDGELLIRHSCSCFVHGRALVSVRAELFKGFDTFVLRVLEKFFELLNLGTRFFVRIEITHHRANVSVGLDVIGETGVDDLEFSVFLLELENVISDGGGLHSGHVLL